MKRQYVVVLSAAGIGLCTALGVGVSSRVLLNEPLETGVNNGVRAGLIAALLFLGAEYTRENVL